MAKTKRRTQADFDVEKYLETAGVSRRIVTYRKGQSIFAQGGACASVLYLQRGTVKLTITSASGKEAVIALLSAGEFFGEGCIAGSLCEA